MKPKKDFCKNKEANEIRSFDHARVLRQAKYPRAVSSNSAGLR